MQISRTDGITCAADKHAKYMPEFNSRDMNQYQAKIVISIAGVDSVDENSLVNNVRCSPSRCALHVPRAKKLRGCRGQVADAGTRTGPGVDSDA